MNPAPATLDRPAPPRKTGGAPALPTLLVVDDEPAVLDALRECLRGSRVRVLTAATAGEGLNAIQQNRPDVLLSDIGLPDLSGLELFRRIRQLDTKMPVIIMTGAGTTETAIEAMKLGAYEYVLKPFKLTQIRELIFRALDTSRLMRVPAVVPHGAPLEGPADTIAGRCAAMQEVYKAIGRVAPQDEAVLILGESGTGKELVARAIYQHSLRREHAFLTVQCGAIPEPVLEAELFGHEKAALPDVEHVRIGKFEQCSGGTLFLDEIGGLSPLTQTKILRLLQEQQFERLGGNELIRSNVRLIAATTKDLDRLVADCQFRSDLYYRLRTFPIKLPPLRARLEDLPLLVGFFVRKFAPDLHKQIQTVPAETIALLGRHNWPGNIRELQSVLKQALLHATGPVLTPEFFPDYLRAQRKASALPVQATPSRAQVSDDTRSINLSVQADADSGDLYARCMSTIEQQLITQVLRRTQGNQLRAAACLGISRSSLRNKIRALGIVVERASAQRPTSA